MKKLVALLLALTMVFAMFSVASAGEAGTIQPVETLNIDMTGADVGGVAQTYGEAVCECIRRSFPGSNTNYLTGSVNANVQMIGRELAVMSFCEANVLGLARAGQPPFDQPYENICVLGYMFTMRFTMVANASLGVSTLDELCEKVKNGEKIRIGFQPENSPADLFATACLEYYGVSKDDLAEVVYGTTGTGVGLMQEGKLDAYCTLGNLPVARFVELGGTTDIVVVGLKDDVVKDLEPVMLMPVSTIPDGTYDFQDGDVPTAEVRAYLYTNTSLSNEEAYSLCKALYENLEYYNSATGQDVTAEQLAGYAAESGIPLHPGAEAFYKEVGLIQ